MIKKGNNHELCDCMKPFPAGNMMSFCFLPLFLQEASQKDESGADNHLRDRQPVCGSEL